MLSGRGLCDELITRLEESYRLWCVVVCDLETSRIGVPYIYDISSLRVNYCFTFSCVSTSFPLIETIGRKAVHVIVFDSDIQIRLSFFNF